VIEAANLRVAELFVGASSEHTAGFTGLLARN